MTNESDSKAWKEVGERLAIERRAGVLGAVAKERDRQEALRKAGKFSWTCASPNIPDVSCLAVLAEEFGEVAREVTEALIDSSRRNVPKLRAELVQTAAVAVAWIEALDASRLPWDRNGRSNHVHRTPGPLYGGPNPRARGARSKAVQGAGRRRFRASGGTPRAAALAAKRSKAQDDAAFAQVAALLEPLVEIADADDDDADIDGGQRGDPKGTLLAAQLRDGKWHDLLSIDDCRRARAYVRGRR